MILAGAAPDDRYLAHDEDVIELDGISRKSVEEARFDAYRVPRFDSPGISVEPQGFESSGTSWRPSDRVFSEELGCGGQITEKSAVESLLRNDLYIDINVDVDCVDRDVNS